MTKKKYYVKKLKLKWHYTFIYATIFLLVGIIIANVFNNFCQIVKNKNQIAVLESQYDNLLHDAESFQSEITKLQDSDYVARYAREKYLYSLPDEVIIKLPENESN